MPTPPMDLQDLASLTGVVQDVVATLAILTAGVWALWRFVLTREGVWNLELSMEHEVFPYSDDAVLLVVSVIPKNIGKVVIHAGSKGLVVYLRRAPADVEPVAMLTPESFGEPILTEEILHSRGSRQLVKEYELEPGCSFRHTVPIVVPKSGLFEVRAVFWWRDDVDSASVRRLIRLGEASSPGVPREPLRTATHTPTKTALKAAPTPAEKSS